MIAPTKKSSRNIKIGRYAIKRDPEIQRKREKHRKCNLTKFSKQIEFVIICYSVYCY